MSICLCKQKAEGPRRCRATVLAEGDELRCAHEVALATILRTAIVDGVESRDAIECDAPGFVAALRAAGWRIEPPRKAR